MQDIEPRLLDGGGGGYSGIEAVEWLLEQHIVVITVEYLVVMMVAVQYMLAMWLRVETVVIVVVE